jgi:hypothetical protein
MTYYLAPIFNGVQQFTNAGLVLAGGKIFTYIAGTSTQATTYRDNTGGVANANPIILDSSGRVPSSSEIWLAGGQTYKFVLQDANGNVLATQDNLYGINDLTSGFGSASSVAYIQGTTGAVSRTVASKLQESISVIDFGADPTGATDSTIAFRNCSAACALSAVSGGTSRMFIPKGIYLITGTINIQFSGMVFGSGQHDTVVTTNVAALNIFTTTGSYGAVTFSDFMITCSVTASGGSGIAVGTTGQTDPTQQRTRVQNVQFNSLYNGVIVSNAAYWSIDRCDFFDFLNYGVYSSCTANFDAGDSSITECLFSSATSAGIYGVYAVNNVRIQNNKFLGCNISILVAPPQVSFNGTISNTTLTVSSVTQGVLSVGQTIYGTGVTPSTTITSLGTGTGLTGTYNVSNSQTIGSEAMSGSATVVDHQIIGNSIEGFGAYGILFQTPATGTGIANSHIVSNEVACMKASSVGIAISGAVGGLVITNNMVVTAAVSSTGIFVTASTAGTPGQILCAQNNVSGGGTSTTGIGFNATNSFLQGNLVAGPTVPYVLSAQSTTLFKDIALNFGGLPAAAANGSVIYCYDGTITPIVQGSGSGCFAKRINQTWVGN